MIKFEQLIHVTIEDDDVKVATVYRDIREFDGPEISGAWAYYLSAPIAIYETYGLWISPKDYTGELPKGAVYTTNEEAVEALNAYKTEIINKKIQESEELKPLIGSINSALEQLIP